MVGNTFQGVCLFFGPFSKVAVYSLTVYPPCEGTLNRVHTPSSCLWRLALARPLQTPSDEPMSIRNSRKQYRIPFLRAFDRELRDCHQRVYLFVHHAYAPTI